MIWFPLKLVRDFIPGVIEAKGGKCLVQTLSGELYRRAIVNKLLEEVNELSIARTRQERIVEVADVEAILDAYKFAFLIPDNEVRQARRNKAARFGEFSKGVRLLCYVTRLSYPRWIKRIYGLLKNTR